MAYPCRQCLLPNKVLLGVHQELDLHDVLFLQLSDAVNIILYFHGVERSRVPLALPKPLHQFPQLPA